MRRTVRVRLMLYGLCSVLAGGVASFLAVVTVDWLLWLPPALRLLGAGLFLVGFAAAALHWVVKPARARLGIEQIAGRLERRFIPLRECLSSAVNFVEHGDAGSPTLMARVVGQTDRLVKELSLESALTLGPLAARAASLGAATAVLLAILVVSPAWAKTGFYRYLNPLGDLEWPRRVSIVPITGSERVALGESVTVRMAIERGWHEALRGVVRIREGGGTTGTRAMQRDADGSFYATIDTVTEDLTYWFEAGDASTERQPLVIRAVRRPAVMEVLATIEPPPYARNRAARTQDLADGPAAAPMGGFVTVNVRASKPIPPDPGGEQVGLRLDTGELLPLTMDPHTPEALSGRFEVTGDLLFRIELRDAEGFENRGAVQHVIRAVADAAPTVTVVEPRSTVEVTPHGTVQVLVRATDDFGIISAELEAERLGGDESWKLPLTEGLRFIEAAEGVEATTEYIWDIGSMSRSPGDVVRYATVATDNRDLEGAPGQIGRSPWLRLVIISDLEFDARVRDEIAMLERRIRETVFEEADLLDATTTLIQPDTPAPDLSDGQRERAASLAAQQARIIRRLGELAGRFERLAGRMVQNQAGSEDSRREVARMGVALRETGGGPMSGAAEMLAAAGEKTAGATQRARLQEASRAETEALDRLNAMIQAMSQWGSFQGLIAKTRDLRDRQEDVRKTTVELGKTLLGKPVESLAPDEGESLKRVHRRQEQVAKDAEQLLARMRQLLAEATGKDPAAAEAIDGALRAARSRDLTKRLGAAEQAVGENRTAAAAIEQKAVAEALGSVEAALRERERRELALLQKRLTGAEEEVAALIEQQKELRAATHEAALLDVEDGSLASLEDRQRTLRRNTQQVGEELGDTPRAAAPARSVRAAVQPMQRAEQELEGKRPEPATVAQDEALVLLEDALAGLEELSREMEQEVLRRTLGQIREDLAALRDAQMDVNARLKQLRAAIEARNQINRSLAREASKLARDQSSILELLNQVMPDVEKVPVFEWALRRVAGWMSSSRDWLSARKIDDELAVTTERVVRELEKLLQAIVDTERLPPETEFAEADGGGGEGQNATTKPVPTVTELLVLKAMQVDINQRTRTLHEAGNVDEADESQLRELTVMAEDQIEVRRLTEMVTAKARGP